MLTSALHNDVRSIATTGVDRAHHERLYVVAASLNTRTRRCSWSLKPSKKHDVVVAVVCMDGEPTGQVYVLPASVAPAVLEVRPGDTKSKWAPYYVDVLENVPGVITGCLTARQSKVLRALSP